jgi:hypothetical protein
VPPTAATLALPRAKGFARSDPRGITPTPLEGSRLRFILEIAETSVGGRNGRLLLR